MGTTGGLKRRGQTTSFGEGVRCNFCYEEKRGWHFLTAILTSQLCHNSCPARVLWFLFASRRIHRDSRFGEAIPGKRRSVSSGLTLSSLDSLFSRTAAKTLPTPNPQSPACCLVLVSRKQIFALLLQPKRCGRCSSMNQGLLSPFGCASNRNRRIMDENWSPFRQIAPSSSLSSAEPTPRHGRIPRSQPRPSWPLQGNPWMEQGFPISVLFEA